MAWKDPRPDDTTKEGIRARLRALGDYLRENDPAADLSALEAAVAALQALQDDYWLVVNTDGDSGRTLYVGSVDPDVSYTPVDGDVWIEV